MKIQLETERLLIREIQETDLEDFFEMDSDPAVHVYIDQSPVKSKEEMAEIIQLIQKQYVENGIGRWAVLDKETGEMLGWCGLKFYREPLNGHSNIYEHGYRFKQKHWGKGFATESSKTILKWGFENLNIHHIYAITDPNNNNSMHVLGKLGFELKGTFEWVHDRVFPDCNWFELEKSNFLTLP